MHIMEEMATQEEGFNSITEAEEFKYVFQADEFESDNFSSTAFFVKYKAVYGCK